jgi:hypothetical protein
MKRFTRKLSRFLALSAADRRSFLAAMMMLPLFRVGLRVFGRRGLKIRLQRDLPPAANTPTVDELTRLGALVNSAAHHTLGPDNCLTRSLYLWWLLQRKGIDSQVRIGVRLGRNGVFGAHAWVEYAGVPINDRPDVDDTFDTFSEPVSTRLFL